MSARSDATAEEAFRVPANAAGDRPFEVLFELARGGMATVYVARQLGGAGFERLVALKRFHRHLVDDPEVYAMASDEARLAALIRHPNVVPVIDVIDTGRELILVQDYVEGMSLSGLMRRLQKTKTTLPPAIASRILVDALRGLHAAHEVRDIVGNPLHLIHRDISPQNLVVGVDGSTRVIDFGIARSERRMAATTRTGIVKGKLQYMAPEQLDDKPVDRRADIFAAGAVLFEAITGERAFDAREDSGVLAKILLGQADLSALQRISPELVPVVEKALSKQPECRYATALDFLKAISKAVPPAEGEDVQSLLLEVARTDIEAMRDRTRSTLSGSLDGIESDAAARNEPTVAEGFNRNAVVGALVGDSEPRTSRVSRRASVARGALGVFAIVALLAITGRAILTNSSSANHNRNSAPLNQSSAAALPSSPPNASAIPALQPTAIHSQNTLLASALPSSSAGAPASAPPEIAHAVSLPRPTMSAQKPITAASATAQASAPGLLLPSPYGHKP